MYTFAFRSRLLLLQNLANTRVFRIFFLPLSVEGTSPSEKRVQHLGEGLPQVEVDVVQLLHGQLEDALSLLDEQPDRGHELHTLGGLLGGKGGDDGGGRKPGALGVGRTPAGGLDVHEGVKKVGGEEGGKVGGVHLVAGLTGACNDTDQTGFALITLYSVYI